MQPWGRLNALPKQDRADFDLSFLERLIDILSRLQSNAEVLHYCRPMQRYCLYVLSLMQLVLLLQRRYRTMPQHYCWLRFAMPNQACPDMLNLCPSQSYSHVFGVKLQLAISSASSILPTVWCYNVTFTLQSAPNILPDSGASRGLHSWAILGTVCSMDFTESLRPSLELYNAETGRAIQD